LEVDAMTVHAYQGFGSLHAGLTYVRQHGKGMFVLAATSNPEARDVQRARLDDGSTLAAHMLNEADRANQEDRDETTTVGGVGVVLGATINLSDFAIPTDQGRQNDTAILPILAPGFGFQGAQASDARSLFGGLARGLLVS